MANVTIGDLERVQSISDSDLVEVETSTNSGSVDIGQLKQHIVADVEVELSNKVDKVAGKGLSSADFTADEKAKLADLENYDDTEVRGLIDGKVDKVAGKQLSDENFTTSEKIKLADLENYDDTDVRSELSNKVDKESGKGLSTNDFTDALRDKLASLEGSRYKGDYLSLAALQAAHPTASPGDYANVDVGAGEKAVRYIWDATDNEWVDSGAEAAPLTAAQIKQMYESNPDTEGFTTGEKSKLAGIQAEATKNQPDAYLRNRENHTGTQDIDTITGLRVELDSKVDDDDSRLTDAREWNASMVGQTEAETGTATTARKWSAQRVKQAVLAAFPAAYQSVTTAFTRDLMAMVGDVGDLFIGMGFTTVGRSVATGSASEGRIALGLGTAATAAVVSDVRDSTAGRLTTTGYAGWGVTSLAGAINLCSDADAVLPSGIYRVGSSWVGSPFEGSDGRNQGVLMVLPAFNTDAYAVQKFYHMQSGLYFTRHKNNNVWSSWALERHSGNTVEDSNGFLKVGSSAVAPGEEGVTKAHLDSVVGDISSILDAINGEAV